MSVRDISNVSFTALRGTGKLAEPAFVPAESSSGGCVASVSGLDPASGRLLRIYEVERLKRDFEASCDVRPRKGPRPTKAGVLPPPIRKGNGQ